MKLLGISAQVAVNTSVVAVIAVAIFISNSALPLLGLFALQAVPVMLAADPGETLPEEGEYEGGRIGF